MNQPPRPYLPGDALNARELSETAETAWRGQNTSAGGQSELIRASGSPGAPSIAPSPRIFARITGGGSGCAALPLSGESGSLYPYQPPPPAGNCYCGIQLISNRDGTISDAPAGLVFDAFAFPLVEMTERDDVPVDAIVWASPSADETHYEFVWEGAIEQDPSGSGCGSGDGVLTNCVTFDATTCIDGVNTTTTTTIEFPFQVRVRTG